MYYTSQYACDALLALERILNDAQVTAACVHVRFEAATRLLWQLPWENKLKAVLSCIAVNGVPGSQGMVSATLAPAPVVGLMHGRAIRCLPLPACGYIGRLHSNRVRHCV